MPTVTCVCDCPDCEHGDHQWAPIAGRRRCLDSLDIIRDTQSID